MLLSIRSVRSPWTYLQLLFGALSGVISVVNGASAHNELGHDHVRSYPQALERRALSPTIPLTILPLGDSITEGYRSTDENGYRLELKNLLKADRSSVQFIGSRTDGKNNPDNQHEGFGGYRINEILASMQKDLVLLKQPNLVLLHAGTNDNIEQKPGESFDQASSRLELLLDFVLCNNPNAVVLLALLIENKMNSTQTSLFNSRVPAIVRARVAGGYHVSLVDMTGIKGDELIDLLHPTDSGYRHMARNWYAAIQAVPEQWWVPPGPTLSTLASMQGYCLERPKAISSEQPVSSSTSSLSSSSSSISSPPPLSSTKATSASSPAAISTGSTSTTASVNSTAAPVGSTTTPTTTTQAQPSSRTSSTSSSSGTVGPGSAATRPQSAAVSLGWMIFAMLLALN